MRVYLELLPDVTIYWGATTVTSRRSLGYWQNRNHVVFPAHFEPTLKWSREFAREALLFAQETGTNLYFHAHQGRYAGVFGGHPDA